MNSKLTKLILNAKRKKHYNYLTLTGLFSIIWESIIFRNTFIELKIPILIILSSGLIAAIIDFPKYKKTFLYHGVKNFLGALLTNTISWGFICCTLFMASNKYIPNQESTQKNYPIIERSSIAGGSHRGLTKRKPTFIINYKGQEKQLVFSSFFLEDMLEYKEIRLVTKKGFGDLM